MLAPALAPEILSPAPPFTELTQSRLWMPRRVVFTPAALAEPFGQRIRERAEALNLPVEELPANRVSGVRGADERETYRNAKATLAVVTTPPSAFNLRPIPPSADWQFHLAEGCPAHCQYCYLAGSLSGPPLVRVFANLPAILDNLARFIKSGATDAAPTTFEASCYTDPLGIEHLTGSVAETVKWFGAHPGVVLRWTSKFDNVGSLLELPHGGRVQPRASVNIAPVSRGMEGGTAAVPQRLRALGQLAAAGYPVGLVIAPIMAVESWQKHYAQLLNEAAEVVGDSETTFELITHRFTPGSKVVLQTWYSASKLDMDESRRAPKRHKFGGVKYVYPRDAMREMRAWFEREIAQRFPRGRVLYWT